ncbi:MAG: hypothetical protein AABZ08_11670 [Planctomycetota bacterium]|mgnify:CR=1 FL=1
MIRRFKRHSILFFLTINLACNGFTIPGLPSLQDGTWLATPTQIALGTATYIVQVSLDRVVRVNVNGAEWTIQQANSATRTGTQIIWKTTAAPPAGSLFSPTSIEYTIDVAPQIDGTLTGTATQAIPIVPGVFSIPTSSFQIVMRRL